MSDQSRQKATVFVGGLDNQVTTQTLHDAFIPFGEIVDVSLPKPELYVLAQQSPAQSIGLTPGRASNRDPHRGFGYVEFSLSEDAREAIDNMDASELFGRVIKVNQAKPQKDANEGLGSKTAVWEQVSCSSANSARSEGAMLTTDQEGYAAKYNADDGDTNGVADEREDPMQGLEGLAEAGPKPQ